MKCTLPGITLNRGLCCQMKKWIFQGLASCTEGWAGRLLYRTSQWAGRTLSWAAEKSGRRAALFCRSARPFSQPAGPTFCAARWPALLSFCLLCNSPACRKFTFFIWKHGPPISVSYPATCTYLHIKIKVIYVLFTSYFKQAQVYF